MAGTVDQKLLRQTKFPPEFNQKVDMQKVNIEVMKKWIASKISEILGSEDDVVIELCFNLLEGARFPNIKVLQIQLTGFLEADTAAFCKELWTLCLSAQSNAQGVPKELLEAKKLELIQEKIEAEKAADAARRRRDQERDREREVESVRQRERGERGERGRGRGRGGRGGRDFDRRPTRDSRSPPRRRGSDEFRGQLPRREVDTYIPPTNGRSPRDRPRNEPSPRRRRSRSRSRTPIQQTSKSKRSPERARSESATPPAQRRRRRSRGRSPHTERGRFTSNHFKGRRGGERGGVQAQHASVSRSRSRSPRKRHERRRRSSSTSSQSQSPPRREQAEKRRQRAISRSESASSRSRSPQRKEGGSASNRERRSPPSKDAETDGKNTRADVTKGQDTRRRSSSPDGAPSAKQHAKRRRSIERYEPRAKRRRNTSSAEPDDNTVEQSGANDE